MARDRDDLVDPVGVEPLQLVVGLKISSVEKLAFDVGRGFNVIGELVITPVSHALVFGWFVSHQIGGCFASVFHLFLIRFVAVIKANPEPKRN